MNCILLIQYEIKWVKRNLKFSHETNSKFRLSCVLWGVQRNSLETIRQTKWHVKWGLKF